MAGAGYLKSLSLQLAAAVTNGIALSQSLGGAGNLTLNGSLVTGGVATFDVARRVGITSTGDDRAVVWTITGTDRSSRAQTEVIQGVMGATAQSTRDFLTVSNIAGSGATAAAVTAGSTTTGSSSPYVIDYFATTANYSVMVENAGGSTYSIEFTNADLSPTYDLATSNPLWIAPTNVNGISATALQAIIQGPYTMCRLTVTSGTSLVTARMAFPLVGGGA